MDDKKFFILNGNNGATYIFNTSNWQTIASSLKFYNARSLKQKSLKVLFHFLIFLLSKCPSFCQRKLFRSKNDIKGYIKNIGCSHDFELSQTCSVLVSPTREKVIIHYHGSHFQKIAFGDSYYKVRKEAEIYRLLSDNVGSIRSFSFSSFYDYFDSNGYCSFKMSPTNNSHLVKINASDLAIPLGEFFRTTETKSTLLSMVLSNLKNEMTILKNRIYESDSNNISQSVESKLLSITNKCMKFNGEIIPLGLVHGDFKPWNVVNTKPLTIFDFEEANTKGLPLEDYLNYIIDPIIRYRDADDVIDLLFEEKLVNNFKLYLLRVDCDIDYIVLIYIYLLGRVIFWYNQKERSVALCYFDLLSVIDSSRYKLDV